MRNTTTTISIVAIAVLCLGVTSAHAQLTDSTQTSPSIAGGQIGKSLEQQVGAGQGDVMMPGSSVYLIKRDPARSVRRGRQLFQRKFTQAQGFGPRVNPTSEGDIMQMRALGAGMVDSCAGCHGRPRGAAGFGGDVVTRPDSRDAPHLFGLGLVEMLADEMTAELRGDLADALVEAETGVPCDEDPPEEVCDYQSEPGFLCQLLGLFCPPIVCETPEPEPCGEAGPVTRVLGAKGVEFGSITAFPDGTVDFSELEGIDEDLRVRPFFAEGSTISIREFVIGAFKAEMGLEAADPILCAVTDSDDPQVAMSAAGMLFDPTLDTFERPPVCDALEDGDGDGIAAELDPALIDHMEFYLLNYFKPGRGRTDAETDQGLAVMEEIGCTSCHIQNLTIDRDRRVADVETVHDPVNGIFNRLFATATTRFDVIEDADPFPQLLPQEQSFVVENIFSDLKRHDLGAAFHEREYDGSIVTEFVTEPLWGVGTTAPYGHDGRSINLEEVILRHGGEAAEVRDRFAGLSDSDRRAVLAFLGSLVLFPPDDTASNLNPGNPLTTDPQDPAEHVSINLGALFQIPGEGAE